MRHWLPIVRISLAALVVLWVVGSLPGCSPSPPGRTAAAPKTESTPVAIDPASANARASDAPSAKSPAPDPRHQTYQHQPLQSPDLSGLLEEAEKNPKSEPAERPFRRQRAREVNQEVVRQLGLRRLEGKFLTLYTDVASSPEVDGLPQVFDAAFPQWCEYFEVDPAKNADWHITGFLMKDKQKFSSTGLLPAALPDFPNGYARGNELWLYDQTEPYYRRHLLLHEGTHAFMYGMLDGCGAPWYMEGMAELLATHRWEDGKLTLRHFPADRQQTPGWGRIKIVADGLAAGQVMFWPQLRKYDNSRQHNEAYGWCWAVCAMMDAHPRYQRRFRQLWKYAANPDFDGRFFDLFRDDARDLADEFVLFAIDLEYGHDVARWAIEFNPGEPLPADGKTVSVAADRGWQSSGIRLQAGKTYELSASGRYQVAKTTQPWISEPNGVSIRYYRGRPLGVLLAAVRPEGGDDEGPGSLARPQVIGLSGKITPEKTGTLYLRINDSSAELADNAGMLAVEVREP